MIIVPFGFMGASETDGTALTWSANTTDFPDGDFS